MKATTVGNRQHLAIVDQQKKMKYHYFRNNFPYYILLLPGLVLIILFRFVPLSGMLIAFKDYDMFKPFFESPWVGLKWFRILFESPDFFKILRNALVMNLLEVLFVFFGTVLLAVLINELQSSKYKKVVQTVSYLPHFLSWVIVGGLIIQLTSERSFLVTTVCRVLGMQPTNLLLHENAFYPIITMGSFWKQAGWGTIIYLAAISGIPPELYEAARIDGAGKLRMIWHITLPGIKFIVITTLLMRVGSMIDVGFEKIFVLQNSMNMDVSDVFSTYNYRVGLGQWNMSFSTALSFFESIINFILVLGADRIAKMMGEEGLF